MWSRSSWQIACPRLIHSDTIELLKLSGTFEPDDVIVLLTAIQLYYLAVANTLGNHLVTTSLLPSCDHLVIDTVTRL